MQRKGTPGAICLSVPGTDHPAYAVNADDGVPFAIVPAIEQDGKWLSGADPAVIHRIGSHQAQGESASAVISCTWQDGQVVTSHYHLDGSGLKITVSGPGNIGVIIPAFFFDGMEKTVIEHHEHSLAVSYQNSKCVWQTENGVITETGDTGYNRNGHYKIFRATGCNRLEIRVAIL